MPVLPKPAKRGVFGKNAILEMSLKLGVPGETAQHVSKIWGSGVQNGFCCSVVRLGRWIRNHPLREGTTPEHVSKIWGSGVQNGFCCSAARLGRRIRNHPLRERALHPNMCPKYGEAVSKMGFVVVPSVSDGGSGTTLSERGHYTGTCVQNMGKRCPKWVLL